jgi:hypothetical protein
MPTTINGTTGVSQVQNSIVTDSKLSLTANSAPIKTALNASGSAPIYACRAWVNFNGTGTVAIRASGNVSSITDNGTGDYTVNFTTAMPDVNYASVVSQLNNFGSASSLSNGVKSGQIENQSITGVRIGSTNHSTGAAHDTPLVNATIFR